MNFVGTGIRLAPGDFVRAAGRIGCEPAILQAVALVEAGSEGFDAKGRSRVLPEPHYFFRLLPPAKRDIAVKQGLAYPTWGEQPYDKTQDLRYARLERMAAIDLEIALDSCSWGLGQIMGANAETCGYKSATDMVTAFLTGEGAQLDGMAGFILGNGLADELRRKDWAGFAKGYNGPGYAKNQYDAKLARAYARLSAGQPATYDPLADGLLSIGDKGDVVKVLQAAIGIHADGDFGPMTAQAVAAFQREHGLTTDGKVGPQTGKALGLTFWR